MLGIKGTPVALDVKDYQHYTLTIPGIEFAILIGQRKPAEATAGCSLRSDYIYLDDHLDKHELSFQTQRRRISQKVREAARKELTAPQDMYQQKRYFDRKEGYRMPGTKHTRGHTPGG